MVPGIAPEMNGRHVLMTGAGSALGLARARQRALTSLAHVIRGKNAGPTQLTIDIFFNDAQGYALAEHSAALSCGAVASLYELNPAQVQRYLLPEILAIKFSMPRRICAGNPGDGDVYGAQQHAPLLGVMV